MNIDSYISEIKLVEEYISEEYNTTTLYFEGPKAMLNGEHPLAVFATISVEFPTDLRRARYATVCCSPTSYDDPEEDAFSDYDWNDVDISYEDIEKLLRIAERSEL